MSVEPDDAQMWNVSFKLFATVGSDASGHFADASERFKARLRQAVVKVVRMSSIKDLRDLDVRKVVKVPQHDSGPLPLRKGAEQFLTNLAPLN